jgi:hypothetical protein
MRLRFSSERRGSFRIAVEHTKEKVFSLEEGAKEEEKE